MPRPDEVIMPPGKRNPMPRVSGQTDYDKVDDLPGLPNVPRHSKPLFEHKFIDVFLNPVPLAVQEDRALILYDYAQRQWNVALDGSGNVSAVLESVEPGWEWLIDKVSVFGAGFTGGWTKLYDGSFGDDSTCFVAQSGSAMGGGITTDVNILATRGTQIGIVSNAAGASGQLSIGMWFRRCKWVWVPEMYFQEDRLNGGRNE